MRWIRYRLGNAVRYGIVDGDQIEEVEGSPFESVTRTARRVKLSDVRILPPVIPQNFYAVGFNYLGHTNEASEFLKQQQRVPSKPDVGYRAANALIGHGEAIVIPSGSSGLVQYEGELVAVIGKKAKGLSESEALSCVLGYTIGNDVSERTWQRADRTIWRSKNSDTFNPMGPWIETDVDLPSLITRVRLNGKQVSEFKTNDMVFGVARYLSEISQFITLHPGDVLWMGTEAPTLDMKAGDQCDIEIDQIGVLSNPVVAG